MVRCLLAILFCLYSLPASSAEPDLKTILDKVDQMWRGNSALGEFEMTVQTANYSRTMAMKYWSKGEDFFLARIQKPKKDRGTATLKRGDQIYNYLPKVNRTIKIGTAMMSGSWMGSHITNDDLVQSSKYSDDYTYKLSGKKKSDKGEIYEVTLIPKPDSPVVWGKVVMEVLSASFIPVKNDFYDEDLKLVRQMTFEDIKSFGGRQLASRMRVIPLDKSGEYTELVYKSIDFNAKLDDGFFSLNQLKRLK